MPALAILTVVVQACFIYHVFKTGRPYWWAFIILSFPVIGCLVYYFVEVFPGSHEQRSANRAARDLSRALDPDKDLRQRMEAVEITPTVANRVGLAEELMQRGRTHDAVEQYRLARTGLYEKDPTLTQGLAQALIAGGDYDAAQQALETLRAEHKDFRPDQVTLLLARVLEARGDTEGALDVYEQLISTWNGLEAKVRHGQLLKRLGHTIQADTVFTEIIEHARRFRISHEEELAWVKVARKELQRH